MSQAVRAFLANFRASKIPRKQFEQTFTLSSGPGGQNVNKVRTKATIKYLKSQLDNATWIPKEVREALEVSKFPYFTPSGHISVSSELTRSQRKNLEDCYTKLENEIRKNLQLPEDPSEEAVERWRRLDRKENEVRLNSKKLRTNKKESRREKF